MKTGFFYSEEVRAVVLGDKRTLLAEIDKAIEKASVNPKMRTVYEVYISNRYAKGHYTRALSKELGERYFDAEKERDKFPYDSEEYKKLGLEMVTIQKEVEGGLNLREYESTSIVSRKVPFYSVEFQVGNCKMRIFKSKEALNAFRKMVKGTPATCEATFRLKSKKAAVVRLTAYRMEIIEDALLQKVKQRGWFTDGHVVIKGEPPKGKTLKGSKGADIKGLGMEYEKTYPAELQYYYACAPGLGMAVSRNPLIQLGEDPYDNKVLFKTGENYVSFIQGKFRAVANRFPDAEYRINRDAGMLVAYQNKKQVAGLMRVQEESEAKDFPMLQSEPAMKTEARKARFLKRDVLEL